MAEKKVILNLSVAREARQRLEALAAESGWPMGRVLEQAILAYQLGVVAQSSAGSGSDWVSAHEQNAFAIELLQHWQKDFEARLSALEAGRQPALPEPLPVPLLEPEPAKIADSAPSTPIESVVAELKRQGLGPQGVADELNRRGYRTGKGTLLQRGYVSSLMKRVG